MPPKFFSQVQPETRKVSNQQKSSRNAEGSGPLCKISGPGTRKVPDLFAKFQGQERGRFRTSLAKFQGQERGRFLTTLEIFQSKKAGPRAVGREAPPPTLEPAARLAKSPSRSDDLSS